MKWLGCLGWICAATWMGSATLALEPVHLKNGEFEHGTFELLDGEGKPVGWQWHAKARVEYDGNTHWVEITPDKPGWNMIEVRVALPSDWPRVTVSARMRVKNLKKGDQGWKTSRVICWFLDKDGKEIKEQPSLMLSEDCDWTEVSQSFDIPRAASFLKMAVGFHESTGTLSIDDLRVGQQATPPKSRSGSGAAPQSGIQPQKLAEVGIEFNATMAEQLRSRRFKPDAVASTLLSVGPGAPGSNGAPKTRAVKYPEHWKPVEMPKELGGSEASPDVLVARLPEFLAEKKPEVVLLWGDAEGKRSAKPGEKFDWEDVITICLRMGAVPVVILPKGDVTFAGGGGAASLVGDTKKKKEEEQGDNADLEALRRTLTAVGGERGVPMMEQSPFATTSSRLAKTLFLIEKHVFKRDLPEPKSGEEETKQGPAAKKPDEVE